ncbi:prophage antirepressor-like protein [Saccharopolyspora lacisalsi]|uniref:Prophage antirepressor-like protein n=1 Tax=Halosaccharopolyspora lacisalsi TaxID=1000566 RepID=A0A839E3P5_9PSEU|nr:BRO family protein [Halosaccharopolyspora lacisalsi]MBA8827670.1 prophage antirepressor-like protein [Halosaccharopolyspora lacisalsi]
MTDVRTFTFMNQASIRVVERDRRPWFVALDVCTAPGLEKPVRSTRYLDEEEKLHVSPTVLSKHRRAGVGPQGYLLIDESGLYSLVLRSRRPAAKQFKHWVTREVLPTIRRTGAYVDPRRVDTTDPEAVAKAAWEAAQTARELLVEERAKRWEVEQAREQDRPKVLVANEFFGSSGLMGLREAARAFGMRQSGFTGPLRRWGWLDQQSVGAKAYATESGYMENKVYLTAGGQTISGKLIRKGVARVARKLVDAGERSTRPAEHSRHIPVDNSSLLIQRTDRPQTARHPTVATTGSRGAASVDRSRSTTPGSAKPQVMPTAFTERGRPGPLWTTPPRV